MKNKIKIIVLLVVVFLTTGCGNKKYIIDKNKEVVKYDKTGQLLQKDILCLPEKDGELYNLYKKYNKELDHNFKDIPSCDKFKMNSIECKGIWELFFVKPLAWLILKLGKLVNNLGLSLMIIGLLIRILLLPLTIKSSKQTTNMKKAQPEIERIERKYLNKDDKDSIMAKSQETMMVYQKYKVNPMMGCLVSLIQLPIFFAFLQAIYRIPAIYEETLFGLNLGMSPYKGMESGKWYYLIVLLLIIASTYFSFKQTLNQNPQNEEGGRQMKIMLYVMLFVMSYASLTLPTALAFYWVITNAFIIVQNLIINRNSYKKKNRLKKEKKAKKAKIKKIKETLPKENKSKEKDNKVIINKHNKSENKPQQKKSKNKKRKNNNKKRK